MKLRPLQISAALLILTALLPSAAYARGDAKYNIDSFLQQLPAYMAKFKTANGAGEFSYLPGGRKPDLYGTTDMVYLLYSLDMLDTLSDKDKQNWAALIQSFQNEKTGWFGGNVTMHGKEHALAYAVGALKLLGAKPAHPFSFRNKYETAENIERMFETTPWDAIWSGSHIASGIASAFINTGIADVNWLSSYFSWLNREADPATGFWMRKNNGSRKNTATNNELGGAFHFYFIYTFTGQPLPFPEKIIDSTLPLQQPNGLYDGNIPYCIDLDGVFALIHAYKQTHAYRRKDVEASLEKTLAAITERINNPAFLNNSYRDSHKLVGAIVALAEIQSFAPDLLSTPKPLKPVLAVSPFI